MQRRADLGVAGTLRSLSFSSQVTGRHWNDSLLVRLSHVPAGHTLSTNFATNLPTPHTISLGIAGKPARWLTISA